MVTFFSTYLFLFLLILIIIEDFKTLHVALWKIGGVCLLTCQLCDFWQGNIYQAIGLILVFFIIDLIIRIIKKIPAVGLADYMILFLTGFWISWEMIAFFLIEVGIFGCMIKVWAQSEKIPFTPCLIIAALTSWGYMFLSLGS